jgi:hypothetical protein
MTTRASGYEGARTSRRRVKQHPNPCPQCPFRRTALAGWLGGLSPDEFAHLAHSETRMYCHSYLRDRTGMAYDCVEATRLPQCAGRAIYWANQLKLPRDPSLLVLPRDTTVVFEWPHQFTAHHKRLEESA